MRLEHVNLTVSDLGRSIFFYSELLGLRVRWQGHTNTGEPAAHVGTDDFYFALFEASDEHRDSKPDVDYQAPGMNHFGLVVDDLDAARERVEALGATVHYDVDEDIRRRIYFFDPDGIEVELVRYVAAPLGESA